MTARADATPGTAVATVEKEQVLRLLDHPRVQNRIAPLLGIGADYGIVKTEVWCAIQQNPEIAECTEVSVVQAIANAVGTGLIIGKGVHLVPFNVKVSKRGEPDKWEKRLQAILDYKGKVELIVRTGAARSIVAKCVYANERFVYEEGLVPNIEHTPITDAAKRGKMVAAYAFARLPGNVDPLIVVMGIADIEAIRAKSKQWSPNKVAECPYWYAEKTVVHRLAKSLPATPRLALALRALQTMDDDAVPLEVVDEGDQPMLYTPRAQAKIEAPREVVTGEVRDQAAIDHHLSQPPAYDGPGFDEEEGFPLDDKRPAVKRGNAQEV